jgi:hypothetical protein
VSDQPESIGARIQFGDEHAAEAAVAEAIDRRLLQHRELEEANRNRASLAKLYADNPDKRPRQRLSGIASM